MKAVGGFLQEFKGFALKGNMIDLAVGIIIGTAFTGVVKSLVDHVFMPLLSYVTPSQTYTQWMIGRVEIGQFISQVINFLIVAFAVFLVVVKLIGALIRNRKEEEEKPKETPEDVLLLTEIRDLLRSQAAAQPVPSRPSTGEQSDKLI